MNRGQMAEEVGFLLNFNEGQADQDFDAERIRKSIQQKYEAVVTDGKIEGQKRWFKRVQTFTWPASQVTLQLPLTVQKKGLLNIWDATGSTPGIPLVVREGYGQTSDLFWYDNRTLQWGDVGPNTAKTILVNYLAEAEEIPPAETFDASEYELIPPSFHWLVIWETAIYLRRVADETVPAEWHAELLEWRNRYWKFLSYGRPFSDVPSISNQFNNDEEEEVFQ